MNKSQIFIILAIVISGTFFGIMSIFELPASIMGWVISDIILFLYLGYLMSIFIRSSLKTKEQHSSKKVTE